MNDAELDAADDRHIREIQAAAQGAKDAWTDWSTASEELTNAFQALTKAPDGERWAAASRLAKAQKAALAQAKAWEWHAHQIAMAHERNLYTRLSRPEAFEAAGIDHTWTIEAAYEYEGGHGLISLDAKAVIKSQRQHLKDMATLLGMHNPTT